MVAVTTGGGGGDAADAEEKKEEKKEEEKVCLLRLKLYRMSYLLTGCVIRRNLTRIWALGCSINVLYGLPTAMIALRARALLHNAVQM